MERVNIQTGMPACCVVDEEEIWSTLKPPIGHPLRKPLKASLVPAGPPADALHIAHNYRLSCSQEQ